MSCLDDLTEILESWEAGDLNIICGGFNADVGNKGSPRGTNPPPPPSRIKFLIAMFLKIRS